MVLLKLFLLNLCMDKEGESRCLAGLLLRGYCRGAQFFTEKTAEHLVGLLRRSMRETLPNRPKQDELSTKEYHELMMENND